jgi:hypothetical protein
MYQSSLGLCYENSILLLNIKNTNLSNDYVYYLVGFSNLLDVRL